MSKNSLPVYEGIIKVDGFDTYVKINEINDIPEENQVKNDDGTVDCVSIDYEYEIMDSDFKEAIFNSGSSWKTFEKELEKELNSFFNRVIKAAVEDKKFLQDLKDSNKKQWGGIWTVPVSSIKIPLSF